jgi:hypothetical protein
LSCSNISEGKRLLRDAFLAERGELLEVTRGFLRFAGGSEDGFVVVLQNSNPGGEVGSMIDTRFGSNLQISAYEARSKLRDLS